MLSSFKKDAVGNKKRKQLSLKSRIVICDSNPGRIIMGQDSKKLTAIFFLGIASFVTGITLILGFLVFGKWPDFFNAAELDARIEHQHEMVLSLYDRLNEIHQRVEHLTIRERRIGEIIDPSRSFRKSLSGLGGADHWVSPSSFWSTPENSVPLFMSHVDQVMKTEHILLMEREKKLYQLVNVLESQKRRWLRIPSIPPLKGIETSGFGWRHSPFGGGQEFHPGIDIAGKMGTPILATAGGTVIWSGWDGGFGRTVKIRHVDGIVSLFGHLSQSFVHLGEEVHRGQIVAALGNTGLSTGPHLHYEILVHQKPVNPKRYFLIAFPSRSRVSMNTLATHKTLIRKIKGG
ncbi:MAG: M23 family metallopeptidase [Leptospirales bacterium]